MANVLFEGDFNLKTALDQFETFCLAVETRLGKLKTTIATTTGGKGGPYSEDETKRQADEQKKQEAQDKAHRNRMNTLRNQEGRRLAKEMNDIESGQERINQGFLNMVLKSHALEQVGQSLHRYITVPIQNFARGVLDITVRFDTLEQLLAQRGKKTFDEIGKSIDSVGKVALLRNFDLEQSVVLYSRLFEATRGAIDDKLFETLGKGLSNVMSTIEPSERRSFFGQIQDVLGGGNVANLDRTLSLAPALKTQYDEIKREQKGVISEQEAMIQAFQKLADIPALNDLETNLKNIHVRMELIQLRIGKVYKDELLALTNYLENKVFPVINQIVTRFEQLPEAIQNTIAVATGLVALVGPLVGALGTLNFIFPNLLTNIGGVNKIATLLPRILSLLNPVTAAIAAIVALMGVLIAYNVAGSGTAFDNLVVVLQGSLLDSLSGIYTILKSLYDIVISIGTAIGNAEWLQAPIWALGAITTAVVTLLSLVMLIQNPLRQLGQAFQFIADLVGGNLALSFERIRLSQLKMAKSIYDTLPFLYKFTDWVVGQNSLDKMNAEIADAEANVKRLDTAMQQADAVKQQKQEIDALAEAYKEAAKQAGNLTRQIQAQEEVLRNQGVSATIQRSTLLQDTYQRGVSYEQQKRIDALQGFDYTTDAGRASAQAKAAEIQSVALSSAERIRQQRIAVKMAEQLNEKRKLLFAEVNKEVQKNEVPLSNDIKKIYENQIRYIDMVLNDPRKWNITEIEAIFQQGITESETMPNSQIVGLVAKRLANEAVEIFKNVEAEAINTTEYQNAIDEGKRRRDEILEKIKRGREEEAQVGIDKWFIDESDKLDKSSSAAKQATKDAIEHARVIGDYTEAEHAITEAEKELNRLEAERLRLEKEYIEKSKDEGDSDASTRTKINTAERESQNRTDQIKADASAARVQIQKKFIKSEEENLKTADDLQKLLLRNVNDRIDTLKMLIAATGDEAKYAGDLQKAVDEKNATLQKTIAEMVTSSAGDLAQSSYFISRGGLGDKIQGEDKQTLDLFLATADRLSKSSLATLSRTEIDIMLENSQKMVLLMRTMITGIIGDSDASIAQRLGAQNLINRTEAFIKALKDAQKLTEGLSSYQLEIKSARLESLEKQKAVNEQVQKELDITREIFSLRRQRGIGQSVLDILSGGRIDDYAMEKEMLERKMEAAKIEFEMAVLRLEIELEITLLRMQEKGATEAQMKAMRDKYGILIDNTKRQGKLQQDLLKEQMDGLSYLSGDIGTMIFQGLAIGLKKIFGGGKDQKVTVKGDVDTSNIDEWFGQDTPTKDVNVKAKKDTLGGIFNPTEIDKTGKAVDVLDGKYKKIGATAGTVAKAIMAMNDLSMKSIRNAIAAALDAFAEEALVQAIRFAAIALSALVFGDYGTAAKAGIAAAAWGGVAVAAKVGAALIGTGDGDSAANSQSSASSAAGATTENRDMQILKQQALSVTILLDIRTDDSVVIKKHVKALNQNTELTTLTMNQQDGWAFSPTP